MHLERSITDSRKKLWLQVSSTLLQYLSWNQEAIICLLQFLNFCHKLQHYAPQPQNLALPQYLDNQNQALFSQIYLCQIPIGEALCVCKWLLCNLQRPSNIPNYHKNVHRKINAWILELKIREKDSITSKTPYSVSTNTSPTYRHKSIDNWSKLVTNVETLQLFPLSWFSSIWLAEYTT